MNDDLFLYTSNPILLTFICIIADFKIARLIWVQKKICWLFFKVRARVLRQARKYKISNCHDHVTLTDVIDQDQMFLEDEIEDWKIDLEQ